MTCSSCHQPHGSVSEFNLIRNTVNETCYTCHGDKRGPFLWEHPPARESCVECHNPHGANNPSLLKVRAPFLCQQCHSVSGHPSTLYSGSNIPPYPGRRGCAHSARRPDARPGVRELPLQGPREQPSVRPFLHSLSDSGSGIREHEDDKGQPRRERIHSLKPLVSAVALALATPGVALAEPMLQVPLTTGADMTRYDSNYVELGWGYNSNSSYKFGEFTG